MSGEVELGGDLIRRPLLSFQVALLDIAVSMACVYHHRRDQHAEAIPNDSPSRGSRKRALQLEGEVPADRDLRKLHKESTCDD